MSITVPKNANNIVAACWNIMNGCKKRMLKAATVHDLGVGKAKDITIAPNLYTEPITPDPKTKSVHFKNLNLNFSPNESKPFCVFVDISKDAIAANTHAITLLKPEDLETDAPIIEGNFPLDGPMIEINGVSAGTLNIKKQGQTPNLNPGETGSLAEIELSSDQIEDIDTNGLTLGIKGSCDYNKVGNYELWDGNTLIAKPWSIDKNWVTFREMGYSIPQGQTRTLTLKGSQKCQSKEDIMVCLPFPDQLEAYGKKYGFWVAIQNEFNCNPGQASITQIN